MSLSHHVVLDIRVRVRRVASLVGSYRVERGDSIKLGVGLRPPSKLPEAEPIGVVHVTAARRATYTQAGQAQCLA